MKFLIALVLLAQPSVFACVNGLEITGTTINGGFRTGRGPNVAAALRNAMEQKTSELTSQQVFGPPATETDIKLAEAVDKIFSGEVETAITLLTKLEEKSPGLYSTAANLGTAYELRGDNGNALRWITKGIERNPQSHEGTEWLHVLILEAKIDAANHPAYPLTGHLIEVPEQMQAGTIISVHGKTYTAKDIRTALEYQLGERMLFVKPTDPYVADMLYSLALVDANMRTVENGLGLLKLAREYGFPDKDLLKQHEEHYEFLIKIGQILSGSLVVGAIVGCALLLWFCYRKKWFFLTHSAYRAHRAAMAKIAKGKPSSCG